MNEELKDVTTKDELKEEQASEKEITNEELLENNRLLRKLKKYTEKYGFNYPDDLFSYVKSMKENESKKDVEENSEKELKDDGYVTVHKYAEGDEVWVAEYNSKHENKPFETIDNVYKFRPEKYTVREVILNNIIRYKFKDSHNVWEECMVFKTKEEAIQKCNELNIN